MATAPNGGGLAEPLLGDGKSAGPPPRLGTPFSAGVNLAASAMGTGILTLPYAAAHCGPARYLALLGVLAITTDVTLVLMVVTGRQLRLHTFGAVMRELFGSLGSWTFTVIIAMVLFLALTAMQRVVLDLLPMSLEESLGMVPGSVNPLALSLLVNAAVFFACLTKSFHSLRFTSGAALGCLLPFVGALLWRAASALLHPLSPPPRPLSASVSFDGFLSAAPLLASALSCHFGMLDIDAEMQPRQRGKIFGVIHFVILLVLPVFYGTVALAGVALFGADTAENVLMQFHGDPAMQFARGVLSLTNALRMPLMVVPLLRLLADAVRSSLGPQAASLLERRPWSAGLTLLLSLGAAMQLQVLTRVMGLLGGTCGVLGCFCVPGLMHLKAPMQGVSAWRVLIGRAAAVASICVGALVAAATAATWH